VGFLRFQGRFQRRRLRLAGQEGVVGAPRVGIREHAKGRLDPLADRGGVALVEDRVARQRVVGVGRAREAVGALDLLPARLRGDLEVS
jgi:hypothetical protein